MSHIFSDSSTESQNEEEGEEMKLLPEALQKCIVMLQRAKSDTEKFAALLMVTKLVKTDTLDSLASKKLINAIGLSFLGRMLATKDVPEGSPPFMFKSIALTVLTCFVSSCHGNPALYRLIPLLAEIISNSDLYEDDLTLVKEAYQCLTTIASETSGRKALVDYEVIGTLVNAYIEENIFYEYSIDIIRVIATDSHCKLWEDEPEAFTKLMDHLCKDFAKDQSEIKFQICEILTDIIPTMLEELDKFTDSGSWMPLLHKGISDILFSKLSQELRNKGLHLASVVLEVIGPSYIVFGGEKGRQLLLIMVHLACIEVRMSLEDKSFQESVSLAIQTTACYSIIEEAIKFLVNGAIDLEGKQKQQLYSALKGAFNGVLEFLNGASHEDIFTNYSKTQMFTCASVRVLGAWLAEETSANKEEIYQILPFLVKMAKHNFDQLNVKPSKFKKKYTKKEIQPNEPKEDLPDLLRFLLPGLCHLTVEDVPRQILIDLELENMLIEYLFYQWSFVNTNKSNRNGVILQSQVLITLCNILMNIVVQEQTRVKSCSLYSPYYRLLKFLFSKLPEIPPDSKNLQLSGSFCTLGLMIFRHQHPNVSKTELSIFRFIQSTIRFLWDGYNVEESNDYATLVISSSYKPIWEDLVELWFLSINTLSLLLPSVPWICDFLIESDWPQTIVETFLLVKDGGIESGVKVAYEDFLCVLIKSSKPAKDILLTKGVKGICQSHHLDKLSQCLLNKN